MRLTVSNVSLDAPSPQLWDYLLCASSGLLFGFACVQEFERANTQRVHQLFNSVDELLYEGRVSSRSESLQEECEEWNGHTPHLRYSSFVREI